MTRGPQRERERARAQKKNDKNKEKGVKESGSSVKNRMESDAEIMRQKQAKANEKKDSKK